MKSPLPPKPKTNDLDFHQALKEIMAGKSITKKEWNDKNVHGLMKDGRLTLHKADGKYYDWLVTDGDLYGDDFYVL